MHALRIPGTGLEQAVTMQRQLEQVISGLSGSAADRGEARHG
jgi:hypothetical protein